ncbi:MAG: hypothetical protein OJF59_002933 [Cytophagales bacterium]|jgi:8-oxo-dGTP diphosphatase|nr:MAG: hypothetical protein OJF59_002933 [Cytophagales bacterium]
MFYDDIVNFVATRMENSVHNFYGNRLRTRVCGVLIENKKMVLVNHAGLGENNFWSPPGGGVSFGEEAKEALKREMLEETGLTVQVNDFLFACEFIQHPLHAIELFFSISRLSGEIQIGSDPESGSPKLIKEVCLLSWDEIRALPPRQRHGIFSQLAYPDEIMQLRGFFKV